MSFATFDARSVTVRDLLNPHSETHIVVPQFQRGYEWKAKQVTAFWTDIHRFHENKDAIEASQTYFMGPIVILEKARDNTQLLDGQQRLVTITILLSALRDFAAAISEGGKEFARETQMVSILSEGGQRMLQLGETDDNFFRDEIQSFPPQKAVGRPLRTHKNITWARNFFKAELEKICPASNPVHALKYLRAIRATLLVCVKLACIPVASEKDAIQIFTTLNNRGLRLAVPDLFLAYLIGKVRDRVTRDLVRSLWTTIIEALGSHDIDKFVRHFWVSRHGDLKAVDLFTELQDFIEGKGNDPVQFVRECALECQAYVAILNADETELKGAAVHVKNLIGNLGVKASLPLLLSSLLCFSNDDFIRICRWVIVFVVRYSIAAKSDPSGMETMFFTLAKLIRDNGSEDVKPAITLATIRETLEKNSISTEEFAVKAEGLILDAGEAKYMVRAIANFIDSPNKEKKMNEANVEHIYPQNPEVHEWGGSENQEVMGEFLWHIGNLTIFGKRSNSKAGNKEYSVKRNDYLKKSTVKMTLDLANKHVTWDQRAIVSQAKYLATFVKQIWNYENPSRV